MIIVPSNVSAAPKGDLYWDYTSLLLTAGDGTGSTNSTFLDSSANNFTVTRAGDVTQGLVSPVSGGGSAYFDGSGDYLEIPNSSAFHFPDDFTLEAWIRPSDTTGRKNIISLRQGSTVGLHFRVDGTDLDLNYGDTNLLTAANSISANTWQHVAACRSGSTLRVFVDGVVKSNITWTTVAITTAPIRVGMLYNPTDQAFAGEIADARIVKGTALYTANFTTPTAPLEAVSGTSLLLNMNNASIVDRTGKNTLTVAGDAQASAVETKFASRSIYFDGTADYIQPAAGSTDLVFGTGDFTVELWARFNSLTGSPCLFDWRPQSGFVQSPVLFVGLSGGTGKVNYHNGGEVATTSSATLTTGVWYHLAVSRASGVTRVFINGVLDGTYNDTWNYAQNKPTFGSLGYSPTLAGYAVNGYLDDIRVTKGVARYTANFDPPTKAFPVVPSPLIKRYRTNTYYQSSIYNPFQNTFATWANMNDLDCNTGTATASANPSWVATDLGATKSVGSVTIGYDRNNSIPGGWGVNYSVSGGNVGVAKLQSSNNNVNWTDVVNLPSYSSAGSPFNGLHTVNVSLSCRYLRIVGSEYFALTQFGVFSP